jgi:hypothetical protein
VRWIWSLALASWSFYAYLHPYTITRTEYVDREVVRWQAPQCPPPKPCTVIVKEPDVVEVVSQDLPCRCWGD